MIEPLHHVINGVANAGASGRFGDVFNPATQAFEYLSVPGLLASGTYRADPVFRSVLPVFPRTQ